MLSVVYVLKAKRIIAAGVVAAIPGLSACSSGGQADAASFSTGTISLTLNSQTGEAQFTDLSMGDMKPGADIYAALTVGNAGTGTLDLNAGTVSLFGGITESSCASNSRARVSASATW